MDHLSSMYEDKKGFKICGYKRFFPNDDTILKDHNKFKISNRIHRAF